MSHPTCTVVTGPSMERCGAPAVASIKSRSGETFHECVAHVGPVVAEQLAAAAPAPFSSTITTPSGRKVRCTSTRRFIVITERVVRRTDSVDVARAADARHGSAVIFDRSTAAFI